MLIDPSEKATCPEESQPGTIAPACPKKQKSTYLRLPNPVRPAACASMEFYARRQLFDP